MKHFGREISSNGWCGQGPMPSSFIVFTCSRSLASSCCANWLTKSHKFDYVDLYRWWIWYNIDLYKQFMIILQRFPLFCWFRSKFDPMSWLHSDIVKFCPNKILQYWSLKEYMSSTLPYVSMLHSVLKFLLGSVWKKRIHGWSIIFTSKEKHTYGASSFLEQPKLSHGWFKIVRYPFISQSSHAMVNIELNPESRCSTRINIVFHKITTPPPKKKKK